MQVSLSGHHVDTDSMRNYVNEKIERLDRHFDQALDIHIVLTVEKLRHRAEATMHVSGSNLHAEDVQEDMYAAIDGLIDKLDRQGKKSHRPKAVPVEPA
ncbi:ribosome hibernation-promoting factor, HPF/YfiA family [Pseudomonadota bacterium]